MTTERLLYKLLLVGLSIYDIIVPRHLWMLSSLFWNPTSSLEKEKLMENNICFCHLINELSETQKDRPLETNYDFLKKMK